MEQLRKGPNAETQVWGPPSVSERWSLLWLAIAWMTAGAFLFGKVPKGWPAIFAVWVVYLSILRFIRTQGPARGFLLAAVLSAAVTAPIFAVWYVDRSPEIYWQDAAVVTAIAGTLYTLPYLGDCLIVPAWRGSWTTLVFPLGTLAVEALNAGNVLLARQAGGPDVPVSVWMFGMYALTRSFPTVPLLAHLAVLFLLAWSGAAINRIWHRLVPWI